MKLKYVWDIFENTTTIPNHTDKKKKIGLEDILLIVSIVGV